MFYFFPFLLYLPFSLPHSFKLAISEAKGYTFISVHCYVRLLLRNIKHSILFGIQVWGVLISGKDHVAVLRRSKAYAFCCCELL